MTADRRPLVMVIDDDPVFRKTLRSLLGENGYRVLEAADETAGLQLCRRRPVELLLVDLTGPVMNGFAVLAESVSGSRELPIIVVSESGDSTGVAEALRLGAWDYLFKPVDDPAIVLHVIETVLERVRLIRENRDYQQQLEKKIKSETTELNQVNSRLQEVVESTKRLLGCGELKQSGQVILEEFGRHMNARGGSIYRVVSDGLEHLYSLDPGHAEPFLPFPLKDKSLFARALTSSEPFFVADLKNDIDCQGSGWPYYRGDSILLFPIVDAADRTIAIISLHSKNQPPFVIQDREIGMILASYASEVLQTAQLQVALKRNEEALMQSQKMEAIGTLAGGIAHDFNNILSAIIGYTDLSLYTGLLAPNIRSNLEQIKKASNRARDLVQQILSFSRTEEFREEAVDIGPIVKEALKLLRAVIPATIEIDVRVPSGLGKVKTDPTRIHQVMMNLCSNATQAMESGSGLIRVVLEKIARENFPEDLVEIDTDRCFCLSITDSGAGIPAAVLPRIFDPYYTTKHKGEGTGLGLAVVHGIVTQSGGTIRVFSESGRGSSFRLYFPAAQVSTGSEQQLPVDTMPRGTERILFVDDEPSLAEVAREMLVRLGYQVDIFTSSVEALEQLRRHPDHYRLLITDQTMPTLSGIDLTRQVRAVQPGLPVVLYTGYSTAVDGPEARQAGIKAFLVKPLSMTRLATVVREVLDGH